MGYAGRKLHTGNPSVQFDEEAMAEAIALLCASMGVLMLVGVIRTRVTVIVLKLGHR